MSEINKRQVFDNLINTAISLAGTQRELSSKIKCSEEYLSKIINGKLEPSFSLINKMTSFVQAAQQDGNNSIYANVPVSAGMLDKNYINDRDDVKNIRLPVRLPYPTYTLPISGNSMSPRLMDGDFVICRKLDSPNELRDGNLYVVQTKRDGMTCKYVSIEHDVLRLWSANPNFKPFDVPLEDVLALYEVKLKLGQA